jgi:hypothetical protein
MVDHPVPPVATAEAAEQRQCGRCRLVFPDAMNPGERRSDWWLCPPCRSILLPGRR